MADIPPQVDEPTVPMPERAKATRTTDTTRKSGTRGKGGDKAAPPKSRPAAAPKPRVGSLESRLADFLSVAAVPFAASGDMYSATIIAQRVPALAENLAELARENDSIKRVLTKMLEGGAWGGVVLSAAAILIPIAQHRGLAPGDDPFKMLYEGSPDMPARGIPSPPAGFPDWSDGIPRDDVSSMGAPVPGPPITDAPAPPVSDDGTDTPPRQFLEGAPPGVVTVAATAAAHPGAR